MRAALGNGNSFLSGEAVMSIGRCARVAVSIATIAFAVGVVALPLHAQKPVGAMLIVNDTLPPQVSITPTGGAYTDPQLSVTVDWCDTESNLASSSKHITLNGLDISSSFSYATSTKAGCHQHATSVGTVNLTQDLNNLHAEIEDAMGNLGADEVTYRWTHPFLIDASPTNGVNTDIALCDPTCFDATLSYASPAYVSMDQARSVTMIYRHAQAAPIATVALDVTDTATTLTDSLLSVQLKDRNGATVTLLGGR